MNKPASSVSANSASLPNGSGAAAILAAGIGSFMLALLAIAADNSASLKSLLNFYKPSGPLSGVTTTAVLVWLIVWGILDWRWRNRTFRLAGQACRSANAWWISVRLHTSPALRGVGPRSGPTRGALRRG